MNTSLKVLHWTPRIICVLAILFISMFALDAFGPNRTIWQQISSFFMQMIPSFVLLILLIVTWKWEFIGGIIFTIIGLGFSPIIFMHNYRMNNSIGMSLGIIAMINLPFIIVGILFVINHYKKRNSILPGH